MRPDQKLKELNFEEHQLFMQLKEVPQGNDIRHHALNTDASKVTAAPAAAEANHSYASHQAAGIVGGVDLAEAT